MNDSTVRSLWISLLLIGIGSGWMLNSAQIIPTVNWIWPIMLGILSVIVLTAGALNKLTFVCGIFLAATGCFSFLQQAEVIKFQDGMPFMILLLGGLWFAAAMMKNLPDPITGGGEATEMTLWIPSLLMAVGAGWSLETAGFIPRINWVWSILLAINGIFTLSIGRGSRFYFVFGAFLLIASIFSVMRRLGVLGWNDEIPLLTIILGVLWFLASVTTAKPAAQKAEQGEG